MKSHEQRVVAEQKELQMKLTKLDDFMATPIFSSLEGVDQKLLILQQQSMANYNEVLCLRIDRFSAKSN